VYLAINGTIYDVTNGMHMYGKGGSYNAFAGRDASRAFVSGCFKEDLTPDIRGLEEMYLPLDDPAIDSQYTSTEMAAMQEQEMKEAKERVYNGLKHWVDFFAKNRKYNKIGYVVRDADWLEKQPIRSLCEKGAKGRKKRARRTV
jgi:hypothetical protein